MFIDCFVSFSFLTGPISGFCGIIAISAIGGGCVTVADKKSGYSNWSDYCCSPIEEEEEVEEKYKYWVFKLGVPRNWTETRY